MIIINKPTAAIINARLADKGETTIAFSLSNKFSFSKRSDIKFFPKSLIIFALIN
jgi:hypothetical protein